MNVDPASYEAAFAFLTQPNYNGGMEGYFDAPRLLVALLYDVDALPAPKLFDDLAFHLSDRQRHWLQQVAALAARRDDAAIVGAIDEASYHAQKARRFGAHNPEPMDMPFWTFMVQRRWSAYQARMQFDRAYREHMEAFAARRAREEAGEVLEPEPAVCLDYGPAVWCFERFGMALVRLPAGHALFIAGEHEDFYDPDFCIYNDVIVIERDLRVTIVGYPRDVFPPTDFHTATLVGEREVYLIGNLGYPEDRRPGETPVYRLDTETMAITPVTTSGTMPGWISRHRATYDPEGHAIVVRGGQIWTGRRGAAGLRENQFTYRLDLETLTWSRRRGVRSGGSDRQRVNDEGSDEPAQTS
jgi:hypothetical protein